MEQELNVKLIEGSFDAAEADLLLTELLRFKIGFHDQKLFRDYDAFNRDSSNSKKRIAALTKSLQDVRRLLANAKDAGREMEIDCMIYIKTKPARY
jgi:hypothetical protein